MEKRQVKAMLAGQLRLLCERSEYETGEVLARMSEAMAALADVYLTQCGPQNVSLTQYWSQQVDRKEDDDG